MSTIKTISVGILAGWFIAVTPFLYAQESTPAEQQTKKSAPTLDTKVDFVNRYMLRGLPTQQEPPKPAEAVLQSTEKPKPSLDFHVDTLSKYLFRGFTYAETPVIRPNATVTYGNWSATVLGNYDTKTAHWNEGDLILNYSRPLGKHATLSAGYEYVAFSLPDLKRTQDIYAGVSFDTLLKPGIMVFKDFDVGNGTYAEATLSHDFPIRKTVLSLTGAVGYNDHYFRTERGLSHMCGTLAVSIPIGKRTTITPTVSISRTLDTRNFENELYGGMSVDWRF